MGRGTVSRLIIGLMDLALCFSFVVGAPPSPEIASVVYSDPTTVTVTWNQLSSEYIITEYIVNTMINGSPDTRTVTELSITIMDVGVDDTLTIAVAAVDEIGRVGTFSDTLELNYTRGESRRYVTIIIIVGLLNEFRFIENFIK